MEKVVSAHLESRATYVACGEMGVEIFGPARCSACFGSKAPGVLEPGTAARVTLRVRTHGRQGPRNKPAIGPRLSGHGHFRIGDVGKARLAPSERQRSDHQNHIGTT